MQMKASYIAFSLLFINVLL